MASNYLKYFITFAYLLIILFLFQFHLKSGSNYNEIICFLSAVSSLFIAVLIFIKKSSYTALFAFLVLSLSNFITYFVGLYQNKLTLNLEKLSEPGYSLFMILILIFFVKLEKKETTPSHTINLFLFSLKTIIFFFVLYLFYNLDLSKEFLHIDEFGWPLVLYAASYAVFQSAVLAIIIPLSIKSRNWYTVFVSNGFLIMFAGDFAARYAYLFDNEKASAFGAIWFFGLVFIAISHVFFNQRIVEKTNNSLANFLSLRSIPEIFIILCLVPILFIFLKVRIISSYGIFDPIDSIVIVTFTCVISSIMSNFLSKKITQIPDLIKITKMENYSSQRLENGKIFFPIQEKHIMLFEFKKFAEKYNELTNESNSLISKLILETKNASVAKTTQMLAHDVRKPFSMLKMSLKMIEKMDDPNEIKNLTNIILPEVNRALSSVNGLIQDVMEIGNNSQLNTECIQPQNLISLCLHEIFIIYNYADISFHYNLNHTYSVDVETRKVLRVFSNIISNAAQAMQMKGNLYFSTQNTMQGDKLFIEFSIKNLGSFIPQSDLKSLFDAFYSKNTKGGTGLGLAIAKKIVQAHGGKIWCQSEKNDEYPDGFVEFIFTFPIFEKHDDGDISLLPKDSKTISNASELTKYQNINTEKTIEDEVYKALLKLNRSAFVLIVDDEGIYCGALAEMIFQNEELSAKVKLDIANTSQQAIELLTTQYFDLVIMDIDLGPQEDGFEIVRKARNAGVNAFICIHSNRTFAMDSKKAFDVGANAFLIKPMSRIHLLKLLLQSF